MAAYCLLNQFYSLLLIAISISSGTTQNKIQPLEIGNGSPKIIKTQGSGQADNVHCSILDKAGNLWFGTTGDGVYRYDGKVFTNLTRKDGLSSNTIWSILEEIGRASCRERV